MNIYKKGTLVSIIVLLMIASVGISVAVSVNESNESNITTENLTIENQTENQTNLSENLTNILPNMSEKMAKNRSFVNIPRIGQVGPESIISYTNPISGISVFGTDFHINIGETGTVTWTNYTFYLPLSSYVYIDISGNIGGYLYDWFNHQLNIDNYDFGTVWQDGLCNVDEPYCSSEFHRSTLIYLNKGYHTIYLKGGVYDISTYEYQYIVDGFISIMAFPEYTAITVIYPNGGETWYRGQTKTITWKKDGKPGANVKIELYKAGVRNAVISSKTPNDGSYSWYVPTYQPIGADYKIKITSYEEPVYYDWSNNNFKIY